MSERQKILIIDDDEDFRISIGTLLKSHNYEVLEAESGKRGLEMIKSEKPDLIVLDIMMETIDEGYLINQVIKFQKEYEEYKNLPILMVSSIQQDPLSRFPKAAGEVEMIMPDYYLTKPVDIPKFLDMVKKLLNK
ncbi:MAG: response regulator [candidate division KSB1 bacterium]|nr:response regulator [candidate division KSB1 bacterium]MDZ7335542.1 response regulator [candidate division KSB1 bacterium]MDZ7356908.1 response regulator [candidate division KSB1 bacterium]MDZ7399261.1 response regulator [candidate division KSB1 bacterium]